MTTDSFTDNRSSLWEAFLSSKDKWDKQSRPIRSVSMGSRAYASLKSSVEPLGILIQENVYIPAYSWILFDQVGRPLETVEPSP